RRRHIPRHVRHLLQGLRQAGDRRRVGTTSIRARRPGRRKLSRRACVAPGWPPGVGISETAPMAIFVLCIRRHDDWAEIARFEAADPADALHKAKLVIPPDYGNG